LTPEDEGELRFGIGHHKGRVVIDFGQKIAWLGLTPELARGMAELLVKNAERAERDAEGM
jgi:hypothetical protein